MGLDTTHDAFHGAYSAFNRFRQVIAKAAGGSFPPHDVPLILGDETFERPDNDRFYVPDWSAFQEERPGLSAFLLSNDCEGSFAPELCKQMADEIEALLPAIEATGDPEVHGHIARDGGYAAVTRRYIAGCRAAHDAGEALECH